MKGQIKYYIIAVFLLAGCKGFIVEKGNSSIEGCFNSYPGEILVINEVGVKTFSPLDTLELDNEGCFSYNMDLEGPGIYLLKLDQQNYITLVVEPGENLKVTSNIADIRNNYIVSGSPGSEMLREFETFYNEKKRDLESVKSPVRQGNTNIPELIRRRDKENLLDSLITEQRKFTRSLVISNPGSLANLIMLNRRFLTKKLFDEKDDFPLFALVDSVLIELYPLNKHVKDHHLRMEQVKYRMQVEEVSRKRLAPGKKAPDFKLDTPDGKEISLGSLEGNPVILYFWASSDSRSRIANQELLEFYKIYKEKGLKVFAVSLDVYPDMWKAAIKADKLDWINVSDLTGRGSPVTILYDVPADLPYYYYLGPDGLIKDKSGELSQLKAYITENL
jgi:peroxiredoxin